MQDCAHLPSGPFGGSIKNVGRGPNLDPDMLQSLFRHLHGLGKVH